MATIRDVAARAGVSQATASRALTGSGPASEAATARVREAAAELGYLANKAARSLRTQRSDTIGLLIPDVRNPFFAELSYVIDAVAAQHGITVITTNADEQTARQADSLRAMALQQVDGLVMVPQGAPAVDALPVDLPVVFVDRRIDGIGAPVVSSDNTLGAQLMVDHLVALGHTNIALIAGPQTTSTGRERLAAALERLELHGLAPPPEAVAYGDFRLSTGRAAAAQLLSLPSPPSAIFAEDNLMAAGALLEARDRDVRVGYDVALVSFDDTDWFSLVDPPMTVVGQDVRALGERAFQTLQQAIAGEPAGDSCLPVRLRVRGSCAVAPDVLSPDTAAEAAGSPA